MSQMTTMRVDKERSREFREAATLLGLTQAEAAGQAIDAFIDANREELAKAALAAAARFSGSRKSRVAALADLSEEQLENAGGLPD